MAEFKEERFLSWKGTLVSGNTADDWRVEGGYDPSAAIVLQRSLRA